MSDLSPLCATTRTLSRFACAARGDPKKPGLARFIVQMVDQTSKRILARNLGMAGGNEHTMQCRNRVFTVPFVIMDERHDRVPGTVCFVGLPLIFNFDRCDGHLPLARSD